jgi:hypothetical protein
MSGEIVSVSVLYVDELFYWDYVNG